MRRFVLLLALAWPTLGHSESTDASQDNESAKAGLKPAEILAVVRANLNQIRHCYEELLEKRPGATGKVDSHFVIDKAGKVAKVATKSEGLGESTFLRCIESKIGAWKFPTPRGNENVDVNYPFVFNPL